MKIKREDYISEKSKQLQEELKRQLAEDKERELAKNAISRIPEHRREWVFRLLSEQYAAK